MRIQRLHAVPSPQPHVDGAEKTSKRASDPWPDQWLPGRRASLRRALEDIDRRIAVREAEVGEARRRRRFHRRMVAVMVAATVVASVVTLLLATGPAAPLTTAIWVVPSGFGGSSVSQSIAAIRESRTIHRLLHELDALRVLRAEVTSELRAIGNACAQAMADGLPLVEPR